MPPPLRLKSDEFARLLASTKRSQNAWAHRLGVSKAYLSQLVNGRRSYPGAALRRRICELLEVNEEELFDHQAPRPEAEDLPLGSRGKTEPPPGSADLLFELRWGRLRLKLETEPRNRILEHRIMHDLWNELKYALRTLRRSPGFSLIAILTLGLAIGANTTLFSTINTVLLRPLAYPDPDQLVQIWGSSPTQGWIRGALSPPDFLDLQSTSRSFSAMGLFNQRSGNLAGRKGPLSIDFAWVTSELLTALGVQPEAGRLLVDTEDRPGADSVALISHRLWLAEFGEDPAVIGQELQLDGRLLTIVGVMPSRFRFPTPQVDLWKPFGMDLSAESRGSTWVAGMGRLKPGVRLEQARQEVASIARQLESTYPDSNLERSFFLETLHQAEVRRVRRALFLLWGAVGLILLIACVNVANLLLARSATRRRELSVRSVLGAGPGRVIRQLLLECLALAGLSTLAGLAVALAGNRFLLWLAAERVPRLDQLDFDWRVGLFTVGLTLATTLLFGLLPALHASRLELADALRDRSSTGSGRAWLRNGLVVVQVGLALVLLCGAGLMIRSFHTLISVDLGFDPDPLVTFRIEPPMVGRKGGEGDEDFLTIFERERAQATRRMDNLLERLSSLPGVIRAGAVNRMPVTGNMWQTSITVEGRSYARPQDRHPASARNVTPGYFETLEMPLVRGRGFLSTDGGGGPGSAIINRAMAEAYWPQEDPIGSRITFANPPPSDKFWYTVVGVVENVRHIGVAVDPVPVMYVPMAQAYFGYFGNWGMDVLMRVPRVPVGFAGQVERALSEVDPSLPISSFRSMRQVVSEDLASRSFSLLLLGFFAAVALVLAFAGIYGVVSCLAAQRRHEFGVRSALGACPGDLLRSVLLQSSQVTLLGIGIGLGGSLVLSAYIVPLLYQVPARDPLTLAAAAGLMLLLGVGAALYPAWRASRIDPLSVLRSGT